MTQILSSFLTGFGANNERKKERGMEQTAEQWIASLEGLSDDPMRRAAQIALAAIDRHMSNDEDGDGLRLQAAYDALQSAINETGE